MLSAVALVNQALEEENLQQFGSLLLSSSAGLCDVDDSLLSRSVFLPVSLSTPGCQLMVRSSLLCSGTLSICLM